MHKFMFPGRAAAVAGERKQVFANKAETVADDRLAKRRLTREQA
jgi:hypothetical protein